MRRVWSAFRDGRGGMSWSRPWALYTLVRWAETVNASVGASVAGGTDGRAAVAV
jgi:hypothetical protein